MTVDYKYISKPYTLDELVNGNPIFKIYYDYLYDIYEWDCQYTIEENDKVKEKDKAEENDKVEENNKIEVFDYTEKEHLELVFNEFLNVLSLLLYDKSTYKETLKIIKQKTEEIEMFGVLTECIPCILDEYPFSYDSNIFKKTGKKKAGKNSDENLESETLDLNKEQKKCLSLIVKKYVKDINNALTSKNINDLTLFFDKPLNNSILEIASILNPNAKRKNDNIKISDSYITSESQEALDASQKVLLLEELIRSDKWGNASDRKKAEIISQIIDRNPDNIRRTLSEINKSLSSASNKFKEDLLKAQNIIKLLG
jgi:hypothetical protein